MTGSSPRSRGCSLPRADVDRRLRGTTSLVLLPALTDVRAQVDGLVHPGFVTEAGAARLPDVARYLRAAAVRLDALPSGPERDRQLMWRIELVQQAYDDALAALPAGPGAGARSWPASGG